jgi:hypothetical protein
MSKTTVSARIRADGAAVEILADGGERPLRPARMRPMTDEEIAAVAAAVSRALQSGPR